MKKLYNLLSALMGVCLMVSLVYLSRQQKSIRNLEVKLNEVSTTSLNQEAEKRGLMEANRLLQEKLAEFREAPPYSNEQKNTPPPSLSEVLTPSPVDQAPLVVKDPYADQEHYTPISPIEPPTISSQLPRMMEKIPAHLSEDFSRELNNIQLYLDANPEIVEELKER